MAKKVLKPQVLWEGNHVEDNDILHRVVFQPDTEDEFPGLVVERQDGQDAMGNDRWTECGDSCSDIDRDAMIAVAVQKLLQG